jgi:hypothetical protein
MLATKVMKKFGQNLKKGITVPLKAIQTFEMQKK